MLVASAVLAILPMGFVLLCVIEFLVRKSKVLACVTELRAVHAAEIDRLTDAGLLAVELTEPRIDATPLLLTIEGTVGTQETPNDLSSMVGFGSRLADEE